MILAIKDNHYFVVVATHSRPYIGIVILFPYYFLYHWWWRWLWTKKCLIRPEFEFAGQLYAMKKTTRFVRSTSLAVQMAVVCFLCQSPPWLSQLDWRFPLLPVLTSFYFDYLFMFFVVQYCHSSFITYVSSIYFYQQQ